MRIQPIDSILNDVVKPPVLKSRLKRLFDRPFNGVLNISTAEKPPVAGVSKDVDAAAIDPVTEFESSFVWLDKMVQNFIEDNNEKQSTTTAVKCGRNRCNCFHGNSNDSSGDEFDFFGDNASANSSFTDPTATLKSLVPCATMTERNLLADTSRIVEKNSKTCKRKDDLRKIVNDGLLALGYDSSVCKSKWEKSSAIPAGEYEYIDAVIDGERVLIDVDFRSEFEIARSTSSYKAILQCLPYIFVGKSDRLLQIISVASEAARLSLKKKGMYIAPWRKSEYMKSKWLGPHARIPLNGAVKDPPDFSREAKAENQEVLDCDTGELDLIFGEKMSIPEESHPVVSASPSTEATPETTSTSTSIWQLPALRPKSLERGNKAVVTGLASLLKEKL